MQAAFSPAQITTIFLPWHTEPHICCLGGCVALLGSAPGLSPTLMTAATPLPKLFVSLARYVVLRLHRYRV